MRNIGDDIRAGRPVTPEDIFRASQPLMRDLAPLFGPHARPAAAAND
jgi:hypothetical protein